MYKDKKKIKEYRDDHKEKHKIYNRNWYLKNRKKQKKYSRIYYKINKKTILSKNKDIRKKYRKSGNCEICGDVILNLCQDHNHITGKNRGLLCRKCNSALGLFKSDEYGIELLCSAISYMRNYEKV